MPRRLPLVLAVAAVLGSGGLLEAHDFWVVPDAFALTEGSAVSAGGRSGSNFPGTAGGSPASIAEARLIGAQGETRINEIVQEGKALRLRQRPVAAGQYLIAVSLQPRTTRGTGEAFRRYLALEGAAEEAARLEREGQPRSADSLSYRSTKYATTVVEVGRGPRAFTRTAGFPLEIVAVDDPSRAQVGDTMRFRVLVGGRPAAGLRVHAGAAADSAFRVRGGTAPDPDLHLLTDAAGRVRVIVAKGGLWNLRVAHAGPQPGSPAAWDVHWATLVFSVAGGSSDGGASTPPGDSAAVARVVRRYGEALAAGDSDVVLQLLSADAVILESGGAETREEYRRHHLPGDIAFARTVRAEESGIRVTVMGDAAWAWSTSIRKGDFRGRAINTAGAELMVLSRGAEGRWQIRAVHWSSRAIRTP